MTEEILLNKKLAEWRGIKPMPIAGVEYSWDEIIELAQSYYIAERILEEGLPEFTRSLDDCLGELVPELLRRKWKVRISWSGIPPGTPSVHLSNWDAKHNRQNRPQIDIHAETPALALCKAIEQLIDKEAKDGN